VPVALLVDGDVALRGVGQKGRRQPVEQTGLIPVDAGIDPRDRVDRPAGADDLRDLWRMTAGGLDVHARISAPPHRRQDGIAPPDLGAVQVSVHGPRRRNGRQIKAGGQAG